jgi:hypothetical protein
LTAGGHVEFEAASTVVINGSTAKPMPTLVLLENLIAAIPLETRVVDEDEMVPIGSCGSYI